MKILSIKYFKKIIKPQMHIVITIIMPVINTDSGTSTKTNSAFFKRIFDRPFTKSF